MKPKTNTIENYQVLISWLDRNLETELPIQVIRQDIVDECDVPLWLVSKSLLMLDRKKYIIRVVGTLINSYTKTTALKNLNPALLQSWVAEYTKGLAESAKEKKVTLPTEPNVPSDAEPMQIDFTTAIPCSPATIEAKQNLDEALSSYKYGFFAPDGPKWFTSAEEAADQATKVAIASGITHLDIVQKVALFENKPTITYLH